MKETIFPEEFELPRFGAWRDHKRHLEMMPVSSALRTALSKLRSATSLFSCPVSDVLISPHLREIRQNLTFLLVFFRWRLITAAP
jgi:hypothetical protein